MSFLYGSIERDPPTPETGECFDAARRGHGSYSLSSEPATRLVKVAIKGFWDERVMRAFAQDFVAEVRKVDSGENRHLVLVDLSQTAIQSQGVFEAFRTMLVGGQTCARRLALHTQSLPMRMQARRVAALRPNIAMFETEADALAWLMQEGDA